MYLTQVDYFIFMNQFVIPVNVSVSDVVSSLSAIVALGLGGNFISQTLVNSLSIPTCPLAPPVTVCALDGHLVGSTSVTLSAVPILLTI